MKKILPIILISIASLLPSCNKDNSKECLKLTALEDNSNFYIFHSSNYLDNELPNLSYSYNQINWNPITYINNEMKGNPKPFVSLNKGQWIYLKGNNPNGLSIGEDKYIHISVRNSNKEDVRFTSSGNVMSLLDDGKCNMDTIPCDYCFTYLFGSTPYAGLESRLVNAPILPAKKLTKCCYDHMFFDDVDLETAPKLESSDIKEKCYAYMFAQCKSLKRAPVLATSNTAPYCYDHMFYGNSSLEYIEIHINSWDRDGDFPCCFWVSFDGEYPMSSKGTFKCKKELIPNIEDPENFSETRVPYHWKIETF